MVKVIPQRDRLNGNTALAMLLQPFQLSGQLSGQLAVIRHHTERLSKIDPCLVRLPRLAELPGPMLIGNRLPLAHFSIFRQALGQAFY